MARDCNHYTDLQVTRNDDDSIGLHTYIVNDLFYDLTDFAVNQSTAAQCLRLCTSA